MRRIAGWILATILVLGLCSCGEKPLTWQEQYDLGVRYLSEGNYEEAVIAFTAAIEIDPRRPEGFIGRGNAYIGCGDTEDNLAAALADYEAALALDESLIEAWLGLADAYIRCGDYDKAMEILREALEKAGNDQSIADKLSQMEQGQITDSSGKVYRETTYDGNGAVLYYLTYTYLPDGKQDTAASYDGAGTRTGYAQCSYDSEGRLVDSFYYHHGDGMQMIFPLRNTLDDQGREVRSDWFWGDGTLHQYTESEYDHVGNRVEWRVYWPDGEINQRNVTEYFVSGARSSETVYHYSDGQADRYSILLFDENDREIKSTSYAADGEVIGYMTYTYNDQGLQLEVSHYSGEGKLWQKTSYEYDENGNLLSETTYNEQGEVEYTTFYQ